MKKIKKLDELIDGEYYWMHSNMIFDNGSRSSQMLIQRYRDHKDGRAYFGDRIWAYDGNNQAMEKYDIYGPVPKPFRGDLSNPNNYQSSEFEKVFGTNEELNSMIAQIRDNFTEEIIKYIPESSAYSSPECVLFALYKILEDRTSSPKEITKSTNSLLSVDDVSKENDFEFFWGGIFSQWAKYNFVGSDGVTYNCAEQYMMANKAIVFQDLDSYTKIMASTDSREQKALGRKIKGFNDETWDKYKIDIVRMGTYLKFSQHPELKEYLLSTGNKIIVEASPYDRVWGIGLSETDPKRFDPKLWRGHNLLGFIITQVREQLRTELKDGE